MASEISKTSFHFETQKRNQFIATLQWVDENYEWAEGICIPRYVLYQHYQDFCLKNKFLSVGPATFGKIIRQKFPKLTTRRLGTRGQSRYHYYGIGLKETSPYYRHVYSGKGLSRFSSITVKTEGTTKRYSPNSKTGTLIPEFPNLDDLILIPHLVDKMETFLLMYRTHCQRILDAIILTNFEEVQNFFLHFWQGMPQHLTHLLNYDVLVYVIAACDVILYKVINEVLIPSTIQEIPENLCCEVKSFIRNLPSWLESSLEGCPYFLKHKKMQVVYWFVTSVRRQLSFIHLALSVRSILNCNESCSQLTKDLSSLDISAIFTQMSFLLKVTNANYACKIREHYESLVRLLSRQVTLGQLMEWIDDVIETYLARASSNNFTEYATMENDIYKFILSWSYFISLIICDLTIQNSNSFVVSPPATLFMGVDKYENEDLIKWGWPEDVWFHVDKMSSAHVYLRLQTGQTIDDIPPAVLEDCVQLVKANSIQGNKTNNIDVVYTMWANLKKTAGMDVGQVGFHRDKEVRKVHVDKRINETVNRLNKTKEERHPDFRLEREDRDRIERDGRKQQMRHQKEKEKAEEKRKKEQAELRSYSSLMKSEKMSSNQDDDNDSDEFM